VQLFRQHREAMPREGVAVLKVGPSRLAMQVCLHGDASCQHQHQHLPCVWRHKLWYCCSPVAPWEFQDGGRTAQTASQAVCWTHCR
jgi:hypothetical protein